MYAYAYAAVIPSEDNKTKTSVFVILTLHAYVYAYVAAVLTSRNILEHPITALPHPLFVWFTVHSQWWYRFLKLA